MSAYQGQLRIEWLQVGMRLSAGQKQLVSELWASHAERMGPIQEEQRARAKGMGAVQEKRGRGDCPALTQTLKTETEALLVNLCLQRECTIQLTRAFQFQILTPFEVNGCLFCNHTPPPPPAPSDSGGQTGQDWYRRPLKEKHA